MTPLNADELTELEALERAATPSEKWEVGGPYPGVTVIRCIDAGAGWPDPSPPEYECLFELWPTTQGEAPLDVHALAALMVALRNAAPRLFAALREAWAANKLYEAERYGLQAEVDRLRADITAALNERDALRAEVDATKYLIEIHGYDHERMQRDLDAAEAERDALRAEVERLTKERNTARRLAAQREGYQTQNERLRGLLREVEDAYSLQDTPELAMKIDAALGPTEGEKTNV